MPNKKKKTSPINVAEKAAKVFDKIYKEGWNGINVMDGEKESCWHEQYAIFVLQFDTDFSSWFNDAEDNKYVEPARFDEHRFNKEFLDYLKKEFPGCKINVSYQNKEFEIIGPQYDAFYNKYFDDLEAGEMLNNGHWVFKKPKRTYKRPEIKAYSQQVAEANVNNHLRKKHA